MGRRGPKPSGKALTSTERSRKHRARAAPMKADDYEERQAVYEALGEFREWLIDRLKAIDHSSDLKFVLGCRVGIEGDIDALDRYRASVRLEREEPVARVKFVA